MRKILLAAGIAFCQYAAAQTNPKETCTLFEEMTGTLFNHISNRIFVYGTPARLVVLNKTLMEEELSHYFKKDMAIVITQKLMAMKMEDTLQWCTGEMPVLQRNTDCAEVYKNPANRMLQGNVVNNGFPAFLQLSNPVWVNPTSFLVFYVKTMPPQDGSQGLILYQTGEAPSFKKIMFNNYPYSLSIARCDAHIAYNDVLQYHKRMGLDQIKAVSREGAEAVDLMVDNALYQPGDIVQPFRNFDFSDGRWRAEIILNKDDKSELAEGIKKQGKLVCTDKAVLEQVKKWKFRYTNGDLATVKNTFKLYRNDTLVAVHEMALGKKSAGLQSRWYGWMPATDKNEMLAVVRMFE